MAKRKKQSVYARGVKAMNTVASYLRPILYYGFVPTVRPLSCVPEAPQVIVIGMRTEPRPRCVLKPRCPSHSLHSIADLFSIT